MKCCVHVNIFPQIIRDDFQTNRLDILFFVFVFVFCFFTVLKLKYLRPFWHFF